MKCLFQKLTQYQGVFFVAIACSSLIGPPVAGAIIQSQHGSYDGARIYSGLIIIVGAGILLASRLVKTEWKIYAKA